MLGVCELPLGGADARETSQGQVRTRRYLFSDSNPAPGGRIGERTVPDSTVCNFHGSLSLGPSSALWVNTRSCETFVSFVVSFQSRCPRKESPIRCTAILRDGSPGSWRRIPCLGALRLGFCPPSPYWGQETRPWDCETPSTASGDGAMARLYLPSDRDKVRI